MSDLKKLLRQAAKPVLFLLTFIFICAFLAHYLSGDETLLEYAKNHPEQAYGKQKENESDTTVTSDKSTAYTDTKDSIPDTSVEPSADTPQDTVKAEEKSDIMEYYSDRTTYKEGFFYEPLSEAVKERITGISYPESGCTVPYDDLNYVGLKYIDFEGKEQTGDLQQSRRAGYDGNFLRALQKRIPD